MTPFAEATAVNAIVPHGGLVTACVLSAAKTHFSTTHAPRKQPHTIALHLSFLRRTTVGAARLAIRDVKLGRRTSTIHVTLTQGPANDHDSSAPRVVGYLTQSNLRDETGISLPTQYRLHPPPPPSPLLSSSAEDLKEGRDPHWVRGASKHAGFRKVTNQVCWYVPRRPARAPMDEWLCFARPGARFTQTSLGYVVDSFPQVVDGYPDEEVVRAQRVAEGLEAEGEGGAGGENITPKLTWHPTLVLNLEVKKLLPEEGVEWLFVRVQAKDIKNGRMDLEVVVLDEGGELVAISNHVCLVLPFERNTKRSGREAGGKL
ncbi:MAG: hypothetical protein LQ342_006633 [Letrouitia transgressa]|nr:MAG: hypothetical protein LQ342_006633 [Letrouitia transgressa]